MIYTINTKQVQIIKDIITLHVKEGIELDCTYSKGNFYKGLEKPKYCYDINPTVEGCIQADFRNLPHEDSSIYSVMFDPPFVCGTSEKSVSIIRGRFGAFKNKDEMLKTYEDALAELYRIIKPKGYLVVKCQDTVTGGKQVMSHVAIINNAEKLGFYTKDLFILLNKSPIIDPKHKQQLHARKSHSYFLVFHKK